MDIKEPIAVVIIGLAFVIALLVREISSHVRVDIWSQLGGNCITLLLGNPTSLEAFETATLCGMTIAILVAVPGGLFAFRLITSGR